MRNCTPSEGFYLRTSGNSHPKHDLSAFMEAYNDTGRWVR